MTKDHDHSSGSGDDNVENKLDSLLPTPESAGKDAPEHGTVDGPVDELLPQPGEPDRSDDDASTREELEVDTTADGVDDFIPLHGQEEEPQEPAEDSPSTSQCLVCGEEIGNSRYCPECGTEQIPASRAVSRFAPLFMWSRPLAIRVTLSIGALLTLLALLADDGTTALIISASTLPVVILIRLSAQLGGHDRNGWIQIAMMVLVGVATGLPVAWLATRIVRRSWFDGGVFHFGAKSFGGVAVETMGQAPLLVWLICGLLLPLIVILVIASAPGALRMALAMPPRENTGMMLSAGVAAGTVIGSAIVYYFPLYSQLPPLMSTSEWTLTIIGIAVVHPVIWVYSGAITGAVVWRYLRNASLPEIALPAAVAIALPLVFSILSLAIAPTGLWTATLAEAALAVSAVFLHTQFLRTLVNTSVADNS